MTALRILPLVVIAASARAAEPAPGSLFYQDAWPEASAVSVVGAPPRWLAVADNEMKSIAVYPLEAKSTKAAPAAPAVISPNYAVDDIEAATVFPWDINGDGTPEEWHHVYIGSCSRTKKGKVNPERDALFALRIDTAALDAGKPEAFPAIDKVEYNRTLREQFRALGSEHADTPWGKTLRDSLWANGRKPNASDETLAGGTAAGFNIEALTVSKDAKSLLAGLRAPLVDGKALLIPVENPVAALGLGESAPQPVQLGEPLLLNLGGLGFRSIEWDAERNVYLIVAGSPEDRPVFRIYTWTGDVKDAPVTVTSASAVKAGTIDPEGITPVPGWKSVAVVGDGSAKANFHEGIWVDVDGKRK